jgi:hypothetical protein
MAPVRRLTEISAVSQGLRMVMGMGGRLATRAHLNDGSQLSGCGT